VRQRVQLDGLRGGLVDVGEARQSVGPVDVHRAGPANALAAAEATHPTRASRGILPSGGNK
jgi:hypothetical protein